MTDKKKKQMLTEADMQTKTIKKLEKWLRNTIASSTIGFVISYWGMQGSGIRFFFGVIGIITTIISVIAALIINMGIRNGKKNVEKILNLAETV